MSGEVLLSDDGGVAKRLVVALAALNDQVAPGSFALIGGLAVMARLQRVHRGTDDIDTVSEQLGDEPADIAVALGETGRSSVRRLIEGVKIDHIDVSDTPASQIPLADLPQDEWDMAFVLAHRWGLDSATAVTIRAVERRSVVAAVTCPAASPASLVTMKLQCAPRRTIARIDKAANDYVDLYRLLSNAELAPAIASDLTAHAPHDLGSWAIERIRVEFVEHADAFARSVRRGGAANQLSAEEIEAGGSAFLSRVNG